MKSVLSFQHLIDTEPTPPTFWLLKEKRISVKPPDLTPMETEDVGSEEEDERRYATILHNDDINDFGYVIKVLKSVLGCGGIKAFGFTLEAHSMGRSQIFVGTKKEATNIADEIIAHGPDPDKVRQGAQPLRVTVELASE